MKITKETKLLLAFFQKKNNNHPQLTLKSNAILREMYNDIFNAYTELAQMKKAAGKHFYNVRINNTNNNTKNNLNKYIPEKIRNRIFIATQLQFQFSLVGREMDSSSGVRVSRKIDIFFNVEESSNSLNMSLYEKRVDAILLWLHVLQKHASPQCSEQLRIHFYFTSLEKRLPVSSVQVLDETHVNTAFTTSCSKNSEIVVYRKEEWFKVFVHESFHNFGLDFSDANNAACTELILKIFPVSSKVNLYESYTETWAEIINVLLCAFFNLKDKRDVASFLSLSEKMIAVERTFSFFQLVKTLRFMGLTFNDLYAKNEHSRRKRLTMYREKTNVLSYYVVKTILLNDYPAFLSWCKKYNSTLSLLQFNKTDDYCMQEFCKFIERKHKTPSMLDGIRRADECLSALMSIKPTATVDYLLTTMRMSIFEID